MSLTTIRSTFSKRFKDADINFNDSGLNFNTNQLKKSGISGLLTIDSISLNLRNSYLNTLGQYESNIAVSIFIIDNDVNSSLNSLQNVIDVINLSIRELHEVNLSSSTNATTIDVNYDIPDNLDANDAHIYRITFNLNILGGL